MKLPNYSDDLTYYKVLIAKINDEAPFAAYLHQQGYELIKQSSGSLEFVRESERIVLQIKRLPMTYFNRNDSTDKGHFFSFLRKRNDNFYKAVSLGLDLIQGSFEIQQPKVKPEKSSQPSKTLEENYHIGPLARADYLTNERGIAQSTLASPIFKGRVLNAYHLSDNGARIANIAFPKYDNKGIPKNYILYNRPYRSRKDMKVKKFRLVLNQKDHYLYHSKPLKNPKRIIFGESGIDLLSYHELHGQKRDFYVSFGGNVYPEKLRQFGQLLAPYLNNHGTTIVSITDNDSNGREYDVKVFSYLINHHQPNTYMEHSFHNAQLKLNIHYMDGFRQRMEPDSKTIRDKLTSTVHFRCTLFSDRILLEADLDQHPSTSSNIVTVLAHLYLPFPIAIHKSVGKDWNEDLKNSKRERYQLMGTITPDYIAIGDKIRLNWNKGPEGTHNMGVVTAKKAKGVECDFGLRYTYVIPFSSIAEHHKKMALKEDHKEQNQKHKTLKNHIL